MASYEMTSRYGYNTVGEVVIMLAFHSCGIRTRRLVEQAARVRFPSGVDFSALSLFCSLKTQVFTLICLPHIYLLFPLSLLGLCWHALL